MKSLEERQAEREARDIATLTAPRAGYIPEITAEPPTASPVIQGLKLSEVFFWPLDRFKPHPSNNVFDSAKTETYWRDLKRDILEAGAILNPLIALPDGTLLEGHSRLRIAHELKDESHDLGKIPVRMVSSPITPEEAERRMYLGNLSRFELDEDTRLDLYAKVWPGYYKAPPSKGGRPSEKPDHRDTVSAPQIAKDIGKSIPQVKRDRALYRDAAKIAAEKNNPSPGVEEIREARKRAASKRKQKTKAP